MRRGLESPSGQQVVAGLVDPAACTAAHSVSSASWASSTVGVRLAGSRSKVSRRWRPYSASTVVEVVGDDAALLELGPADPAAGVLVVLADADEAEEHLPGGLAVRGLVERLVDRFGPPSDGRRPVRPASSNSASVIVFVCRSLEQLGHRVLHQRERAGLQLGLGGDPLDERRLDLDAHRSGRESHGVGQLGGGHRARGRPCGRDRVAEAGMSERAGRSSRRATWRRRARRRPVGRPASTIIWRNARRSPSSTVWVNSSSSWSMTTSTLGVAGDELADDVVQCARSGR